MCVSECYLKITKQQCMSIYVCDFYRTKHATYYYLAMMSLERGRRRGRSIKGRVGGSKAVVGDISCDCCYCFMVVV